MYIFAFNKTKINLPISETFSLSFKNHLLQFVIEFFKLCVFIVLQITKDYYFVAC